MLHSKKKRELVVEQKNTYTIQHATDHVARFTRHFPPLIKTVEGKEYGIHLVSNVYILVAHRSNHKGYILHVHVIVHTRHRLASAHTSNAATCSTCTGMDLTGGLQV